MANFQYKIGDMFETQAQAIINTVNCVGVMGKGVALEFKNRWKDNFNKYKKACDNNEIITGKVFIVDNEKYNELLGETNDYQYLINFPTKKDWRSKSKIEYIKDGLDDLVKQINKYKIKSIVIPPLGCGNGQLNWMEVKPIIKEKLSVLDDDIDIILYEPKYDVKCPEHTTKLHITKERAILLKIFQELELPFGGALTHLCMQKTAYFLEQLGFNYNAKFAKNKWGPFSGTMEKAFNAMEKAGYLDDFSNGTATVSFTGVAETDEFIKKEKISNEVEDVVKKIRLLFEGYEGPFGLELLSTVHYCYTQDKDKDIVKSVHSWSERKKDIFTEPMIQSALNRLREDKIL